MAATSPTRPTVQSADALSARGLRSRAKIKAAALALLNKNGFNSLRVQDVAKKAGVANGLFYRYFPDLRSLAYELCRELFEQINHDSKAVPLGLHPYDWIYEVHLIPVRHFSDNPGLLACMFELPGDCAEFGEIWKESAHTWNLQVANFLRETRMPAASRDAARKTAFVLGAMTEGIIYQSLIRHTEDLLQLGRSPEAISEVIAIMWYRAIFFENPPAAKLRSKSALLK